MVPSNSTLTCRHEIILPQGLLSIINIKLCTAEEEKYFSTLCGSWSKLSIIGSSYFSFSDSNCRFSYSKPLADRINCKGVRGHIRGPQVVKLTSKKCRISATTMAKKVHGGEKEPCPPSDNPLPFNESMILDNSNNVVRC